MKFISWNVNGLRACIQKGFLDEFNRLDADFFCLQETKLSAGQLELDMPGYLQYWCYADKKGYSGTAIFTKHTPLSVSYGIGAPEMDNEGRVITLEYREFYLVTCYTPNAQRGLARIDHRLTWDEAFRNYLRKLDVDKPVVLCGDLNVAHQEIDLKNPTSNRGNAGFSDEERQSFQKTLDLGFTDTFRYLYPDVTGRYSWWSYMFHARENNAGWRIDYFLVSDRLNTSIQKSDIYSQIMGSDHCPVMLELDTLVNGAIWSPTAGTASVVETQTPKNKAAKASPVNGKALALFCLLLSVIITVMTLPLLHTPSTEAPTDPSVDDNALFTVHVLPQQFDRVGIENPWHDLISGTYYASDLLSDDCGTYYVDSFDFHAICDSNFWLRVELTEAGLASYHKDWQLFTFCISDLLSSTAGNSKLVRLTSIPYYADETKTQPAGWLIWGLLRSSSSITVCLNGVDYSQSIDLIVPSVENVIDDPGIEALDFLTVHAYYVPPQTFLIADNPLSGHLLPAIGTSDGEIWYINPYANSIYDRIAQADFWYRISLTEEALHDLQGESFDITYSAVVAGGREPNIERIPYYTDSSMKQVAGWFLFGDDTILAFNSLNLTCNGITYSRDESFDVIPYLRTDDAIATETLDLMKHILINPGICSDLSDQRAHYFNLCAKYPALDELIKREDAVDVLMNSKILGDTLTDDGRYVIAHLLDQPDFQKKMTPYQEASYLLNCYSTSPYAPYVPQIDISLDPSVLTTEALITYIITNFTQWSYYFEQCSSLEAKESMYTCFFRNLYTMELETREDAHQQLQAMTGIDEHNLIFHLLQLWPYMQQLNGEILYGAS